MTEFEALMWRVEADPRLRSTMIGVVRARPRARLGPAVGRARVGIRLIPRFRQRVVDPPLHLGMPAWIADPDFDLAYHLRRVQLPDPGASARCSSSRSRSR